jgi:predicted dehydrogenase
MVNKIKIGVVGTGHLGTIHTRLWKTHSNVELIGIYDVDTKRASKLAEEHGFTSFSTLDDAIANCDALTIAAPTSIHYEIAKKCIENNVHCLIEKPITENYSEAVDLINTAKKRNLVIQVGHVERFNPALAALKHYNLAPKFIEAHRLSQFKPRATDVSVIHDLMIHDIDIMLWLIDSKVSKIDANGVAILTDNIDIANARITFENGAVANLTASRISAKPMRKMRIFQKNAYISIDFGNQDVEVFRIKDDGESSTGTEIPAAMLGTIDSALDGKSIVYEKPIVVESNAIFEEQKAFVEAILNHSPVAVSAEEAAEALNIAEQINNLIK